MSGVVLTDALGSLPDGPLPRVYFNCGLPLPYHFMIGEVYTIMLLGHSLHLPACRYFTLERHCQVFVEWPECEKFVEDIIARRGYRVGMYQWAEISEAPKGTRPMGSLSFLGTYRNRGV